MGRAIVTSALLAAVVLVGCGDDDEPSPTGGRATEGNNLEVVAEDIRFGADRYTADAGTLNVRYVNDGSIVHTLLIEDVPDFKLEVRRNGDEDEGAVDLEAGSYVFYCDVPGHREAGMEAELEVG